tara:strand:- start:72 stop:236 length:165 start_codon:yes stop_codon:yes gene_type:complete
VLDLLELQEGQSGFQEEYFLDLFVHLDPLELQEEQKAKETYKEYHQDLNLLEYW